MHCLRLEVLCRLLELLSKRWVLKGELIVVRGYVTFFTRHFYIIYRVIVNYVCGFCEYF